MNLDLVLYTAMIKRMKQIYTDFEEINLEIIFYCSVLIILIKTKGLLSQSFGLFISYLKSNVSRSGLCLL